MLCARRVRCDVGPVSHGCRRAAPWKPTGTRARHRRPGVVGSVLFSLPSIPSNLPGRTERIPKKRSWPRKPGARGSGGRVGPVACQCHLRDRGPGRLTRTQSRGSRRRCSALPRPVPDSPSGTCAHRHLGWSGAVARRPAGWCAGLRPGRRRPARRSPRPSPVHVGVGPAVDTADDPHGLHARRPGGTSSPPSRAARSWISAGDCGVRRPSRVAPILTACPAQHPDSAGA